MSTITLDTADAALESASTAEQAAALAQRLLESVGPALELLTVELGHRVGLYAAIDAAGSVTAADLARRTGYGRRQLREWLDQQAIAGILEADAAEDEDSRAYRLPAAHRPVLLDPTSLVHGAGLASMFAGIASTFDAVAGSFADGGAVGFAQFGAPVRQGLEMIYRPGYTHALASWLEQLPDIEARLDAGGVILDAGCGTGWSSIALARRFPHARVVGVDLDVASVAEARRHAEAAGVADRVRFERADVGDATTLRALVGEQATLVTVFLALHDMNDPQRALAAMAGTLAAEGAILVGDAKVADEFVAPAGELDRMFAAFSVLHCLPATLAEGAGHAHGTVLRAPTVAAWSAEAGLRRSTRLAIDHPTWSFYRLDP
ncbi:class I SAM-dependent methyltransferase [Microbacterium atlanticum]|uniref:class I SAM-dependent methyltransferase n=1 Tax=Microbacterium atlanticum TaxID=2782168 RepID=UPI001889787B|nr:class I SAM-dependent methyltransferase [Microbacterium atlanticum]